MTSQRPRRQRSRRLPLVLLTCVALGTACFTHDARAQAASADEVKIARQTAQEGLAAYKDGQFEKAVGLFDEAKALYPSGQIFRMLGYSLLGLERWEAAAVAMESALESTVVPLGDKDRVDVNAQLAKALAHMTTVTVKSKVEGSELVVDSKSAHPLPLAKPLRLVEGLHTFVVRAPEHTDAKREMKIEGGKTLTIDLEPEPFKKAPVAAVVPPPKPVAKQAPPPEESQHDGWFAGQKLVGFGAVGGGVLAGGAALTAALMGAHLRSNVEADIATHEKSYGKGCSQGDSRLCQFDSEVINHDADNADSLRDVGLFVGIGAGVLVAGGAVLVIFSGDGHGKEDAHASSRAPAPTSAKLACGPLGAGLLCGGTF